MRLRTLLPLAVFAFAASGCVATDELGPVTDGSASLPIFASAQDFADIKTATVDPCGTVVKANVSFTAKNQAYGVAVALDDGGKLDVEAIGDPTLDTVLAIYGPDDGTGNYGPLPLTVDDASGPGELSAIAKYAVPEPGGYFVVITTSGGNGLGDVTLAIAGTCGPDCANPGPDGTCNEGCVDEAGVVHAEGEAWTAGCTTCHCAPGGQVVCDPNPGCGDGCTDPATGQVHPIGAIVSETACEICVCAGPEAIDCSASAECGCEVGCDDNDPCTQDKCNPAGNCVNTPIPGCGLECSSDADCADTDPCTADFCENGVCNNLPVPGCGFPCESAADCDDGNECTVDSCELGACQHVPTDACNGCTDDSQCDDGDPCTAGICDPTTGQCDFLALPTTPDGLCGAGCFDPQTGEMVPPGAWVIHDDGCTECQCVDGGELLCNDDTACLCEVPCDDGDPCTEGSCDPATGGCVFTPIDCDDGDPCTVDMCDPDTGGCWNMATPGAPGACAGACVDDAGNFYVPGDTFTHANGCTVCTCEANGEIVCSDTAECPPPVCDDGNVCTNDVLSADGTCVHEPLDGMPCGDCGAVCLDGACWDEQPFPQCQADSDCDDGDPCTMDLCQCDPSCGSACECLHEPIPGCGG